MTKYFPEQHDNEIVEFRIRKHWIIIAPAIIKISLYLALVGVLYWSALQFEFFSMPFRMLTLAIASQGLAWVLYTIQLYLIDHFLDVIIVTNYRLIDVDQEGLFNNVRIEETNLHNIIDCEHTFQGFWGNLLRFGKLRVRTASDRTVYDLEYVPRPSYYGKKIMHAAAMARHGSQYGFSTNPDEQEVDTSWSTGGIGLAIHPEHEEEGEVEAVDPETGMPGKKIPLDKHKQPEENENEKEDENTGHTIDLRNK